MSALPLILALVLPAQSPPWTPDAAFKAATADLLTAVAPEKRHVTRYLDLTGVPDADRPDFLKALAFAINSTSFRVTIVPLVVVNGSLVRLDLEAVGWDAASRRAAIAKIELAGVNLNFKDARTRHRFIDIWEDIARFDPYFITSWDYGGGHVVRGWIDPATEVQARLASFSARFIVRANWLLPRLMVERQDGGFYSQLLLLPPSEADLYKRFGVDIAFVDRENQLKQGGAVLESIVALHNRELQLIPSLFGRDERFIWRTFDFARDDTGDKSVLERFAGEVVHDGREIIGTLPNGTHWYYLADGKGNQVNVVPQNIALDMRATRRDEKGNANPQIRDRNVTNAQSCVRCHGPQSGTYPFDDVVSRAILDPDIGLAVLAKDKQRLADRKQAIEDYYLSDLGRKIGRQQESYAVAVFEATGLKPGEATENFARWYDHFFWDLVTPEQAALEMGYRLDDAKALWRASGNPQLVILSSGQPIRRAAFEKSVGDGFRAAIYPFEQLVQPAKVKVKVPAGAY